MKPKLISMRSSHLASQIFRRAQFEYRALSWRINQKLQRTVTVPTKQGLFTLLTAADESIGRSLYCRREYEFELMSLSMSHLRSIDRCPPKGEGTVIDVGANNGVISIGMLYTGEAKRAIAIEPEPRNFSLLQHNVEQNKLQDRIICLPYAVSDRKEKLEFELSDSNFGDHRVRTKLDAPNLKDLYQESNRRVISIESDRLDNLVANLPEAFTREISVLWVDAQGYEGYVFQSAKELLAKGVPVISELWPYGIQRAGMSQKQFCDLAAELWSSYWVMRREKFVRYPIQMLDVLFDEIGYERYSANVIFTR
jgi:FkbM family methyltransferase